MAAPIYQNIQQAATEKNEVAVEYAKRNEIARFFMFCMPLRYAMTERLGIPCCNPDPITGEQEKFPKDPSEKYDIHDLRAAVQDPTEALKNLFHRKNTIGHKEDSQVVRMAQQYLVEPYEEDRNLKDNTAMDEYDDRELNEFI